MFDGAFSMELTGLLRAAAEILILSYLLYQVILVVRGTRAAPVVMGVLLVVAMYHLAAVLGLTTLHWLIGTTLPYAILAAIVIFQPEIRRALRQMALNFLPKGRPARVVRHEYEDVIFAVAQLAEEKIGALIVFERETGLRTFIQSGVALEARLTSDLLVSIFQRRSPLHDGAVIIQRGKIAAAACFLPLTTNPELVRSLGTRHHAAIGASEESDCLAIVVSETTGGISIASGGNIDINLTADRLRLRMIQHLGPVVSPPRGLSQSGTGPGAEPGAGPGAESGAGPGAESGAGSGAELGAGPGAGTSAGRPRAAAAAPSESGAPDAAR